jgi:hypothetical protein
MLPLPSIDWLRLPAKNDTYDNMGRLAQALKIPLAQLLVEKS